MYSRVGRFEGGIGLGSWAGSAKGKRERRGETRVRGRGIRRRLAVSGHGGEDQLTLLLLRADRNRQRFHNKRSPASDLLLPEPRCKEGRIVRRDCEMEAIVAGDLLVATTAGEIPVGFCKVRPGGDGGEHLVEEIVCAVGRWIEMGRRWKKTAILDQGMAVAVMELVESDLGGDGGGGWLGGSR